MTNCLHTPLCDLLGIDHPILLAGMGSQGRATPPALVAAVSNAGGVGFIGGSNLDAGELGRVVREVKGLTSKPFGVHLIVPQPGAKPARTRGELRGELMQRYPQHVALVRRLMSDFGLEPVTLEADVAVSQAATADGGKARPRGNPAEILHEQVAVLRAEGVPVVGVAMGALAPVRERLAGSGARLLGLATSVAQAAAYEAEGADLVVAQGAEAGGHVGRVGTYSLVPQVVDAVRVPVLAAGGISDGRGVAAALMLGAQGAWIGTAFLVAQECAIPEAHKRQIIDGRSEEFRADRIWSGSPMRGFRNVVIRAWEEAGLDTLPMPWQKVLMDDFNAAAAAAGRWELHSNPAGEGAGLLHAVRPAAEIVRDMVAGAEDAMAQRRR